MSTRALLGKCLFASAEYLVIGIDCPVFLLPDSLQGSIVLRQHSYAAIISAGGGGSYERRTGLEAEERKK